MSTDRLTRVNELLKREIGTALFRILAEGEADLATVTVTSVHASTNLRSARVKVSIRDTDEKRHEVLSALKRHRTELQDIINKNMNLKYTPRLSFELDLSVEKGDHVLEVLAELEDFESGDEFQEEGETGEVTSDQ
jgi:ribosome-binding factor A